MIEGGTDLSEATRTGARRRSGLVRNMVVAAGFLLSTCPVMAQSTPISITGRIADIHDRSVPGCRIVLVDSSPIATVSNSLGRFSLQGNLSVAVSDPASGRTSMLIQGTGMQVQVKGEAVRLRASLFDISGSRLAEISDRLLPSGTHSLALPEPAQVLEKGIVLLEIDLDGKRRFIRWNRSTRVEFATGAMPAGKVASVEADTPKVDIHCEGFKDRRVSLPGYQTDAGVIVLQRLLEEIRHVGTTTVWDANGQAISIALPSGTAEGDLQVLALHRTDDYLPMRVKGWTRVAECYKKDNGYACQTEKDCKVWRNADFCESFADGGLGRDLAQAVFVKAAGPNEPKTYQFDLNFDSEGHPGWIILTTLRGAATADPVRDWAHKGCDASLNSAFPSVHGEKGDMLLLSQSFDDVTAKANFLPPAGTSHYGYVSNSDEAGFLFGGLLAKAGETGIMKTLGPGASDCKDALVSLTVKPK